MFVMPMRPGPFPGVIREVQLQCTPVIASNVSGSPEILTTRDSVLIDGLEPELYAAEMNRLIEEPDRWRQLALGGHFARRTQTWADTIRNFLGILDECRLIDTP
jgi:glycosyltransferase involved in cell wall biosynthesis